ncbi:MAG: hypothetical protein RLY14_2698 [Planctomycetota bacterium]|jgi:hypothetical protein
MKGLLIIQFILKMLPRLGIILAIPTVVLQCACSSTKAVVGTEQLLMSDAIDRTVSEFDFRPLAGNRIFLDPAYIVPNRNPAQLVNTDYVISSLRQQMISAGCQLVANRDEADIIAEARLGALGTDGQMIIYGIPENNFLNRAASVIPNTPQVPSIPEVALAKKDLKSASAKLAVFAFDRHTLEPVWQSGLVQSESTAIDSWVLGVGPFRRGTIQDATKVAEKRRMGNRPLASKRNSPDDNPLVSYSSEWVYSRLPTAEKSIQTANGSESDSKSVTTAGGANAVSATNVTSAGIDGSPTAVPSTASSNPGVNSSSAGGSSVSGNGVPTAPAAGTSIPASR